MRVQFSEHAAECNVPLRRYFLLIPEEQHLVSEEGFPDLVEFLCGYTIGKRNTPNFRAQVRRVRSNFDLRTTDEGRDHYCARAKRQVGVPMVA